MFEKEKLVFIITEDLKLEEIKDSHTLGGSGSEEVGDGEGTTSEVLSRLSYTLKYISLMDVVILCQVGFR